MLILAGTITLDPAKVDTAMEAAHAAAAATRAEPGNLDYCFSVDTAEPGTLRVFEQWENQEALDAHFGMPHMATFMAAMGDFGITGTNIMKFETAGGEKFM